MNRDVVGRATELAVLHDLLATARAGRGGVLAVVGPPGIGKTLLLESATADAHVDGAARLVRLTGVEAERNLPFAGLCVLVTALSEHLDSLTAAQSSALLVATGEASGPPPGRVVLGGALVALVSARAELQPVVVVVDDLQWVDRASAEVIVFAARRLHAERVAVLLGSRPDGSEDADGLTSLLRSVPELRLTGLPADQSPHLLPRLAPEVARALTERTGGNPLAMLELAARLDEDVCVGTRPLPSHLPPTSPSMGYRRLLSLLPPAAREAGRLWAYAGRAPGDLVEHALAKLSISLSDLEPLEQSGLGRLTREGVQWRHPLVRSAAAEGSIEQVRRIHAVLGESWASEPDGRDHWAWHMAESVSGRHQQFADALAKVAAASAARDASLAAADAWERASQLSEDPTLRHQWLGMAGSAAFRGGAAVRAARLYDLALDTAPTPAAGTAEARAVLLHERGRVEHALGQPSRAFSLLMEATKAGRGRERVWAAGEAVFAGMYARRLDWVRLAASTARALHDPADPVQRFLAHHADGAAASLVGDGPAAQDALQQAQLVMAEESLLDDHPGLLLWAVNADLFLDRPVPPLTHSVEEAVSRLLASGELMWSPRVVRLAGVRDHSRGSWDRACAAFEQATELSRLSGQRTQVAEGLLCQAAVEAARGEREACWAHTEEAREIVDHLEVRWLADDVWSARGLLHLSLGEPQAAADCYRRCTTPDPGLTAGLVEALVRHGDRAGAEGLVAREGGAGPGSVARCLVADDLAAAHRLLEHADGALDAFEAARWRHLGASMLRRCGARREAREHLRTAESEFAALRATPWLHAVRLELRATGATVRQGPEGQSLTAGELRVAQLASRGGTNKEIASALFLSTKTVEFHLGRAFRKLGVTNRTALAARLADSSPAQLAHPLQAGQAAGRPGSGSERD